MDSEFGKKCSDPPLLFRPLQYSLGLWHVLHNKLNLELAIIDATAGGHCNKIYFYRKAILYGEN
jgi:hypothetical protein